MSEYRCKILDADIEDDNKFLVMLVPVHGFPDSRNVLNTVRQPLMAVVAANLFNDEWSFICLDLDEKHCIGDALLKSGANPNEWKYCLLYRGDKE